MKKIMLLKAGFFALAWMTGISAVQADSFTSAIWSFEGPRGLLCPPGFGDVPDGTPFSGQVSRIVVDPRDTSGNTVYVAASSGGLWRTTNGLSNNPSFTPLSDPNQTLSIGALAIDFSQTTPVIYVGSGDPDNTGGVACYNGTGVLISRDGGATWLDIPSADNGLHPFDGLGFSRLIVDPRNSNVILASTGTSFMADVNPLFMPHTCRPQGSSSINQIGLYRSADAGNSWTQVSGGGAQTGAMEIMFEPVSGLYFAGGRNRSIESSPDGITWTPVLGSGLPPAASVDRVTLANRNGVIWALFILFNAAPELLESSDQGGTWISRPLPPGFGGKNLGMSYVAAPPNSTSLLVANEHLFRNPDITAACAGGACWTDLRGFLHGDHHDITFVNDQVWYVGDDGGAWETQNAGPTFTSMNANLPTCEFFGGDVDRNGIFLGGMQDNGSAFSVVLGQTWQMIEGGDGVMTRTDPREDGSVYYAQHFGSDNDFFRPGAAPGITQTVFTRASTSNSDFLQPQETLPTDPRLFTGTPAASSFDFTNASILLYGEDNLFLVGYNASNAQTITQQAGSDLNQVIRYLSTVPEDPASAWATTDKGLFKFSNITFAGNATSTQVSGGPVNGTDFLGSLAAVNGNTVILTKVGFIDGQKVFKTTDGGNSWTNISGNLPNTPIHWVAVDPADSFLIYLSTDLGVYLSEDGGVEGEQWLKLGGNLPTVSVLQTRISPQRRMTASTYGRGIWSMNLPAPPATPTPTFTPTPTPTPCVPSLASPNLDLKIKRIQCSPNQVVYRVFVQNNSPNPVNLSDLTVKLWAFDTGITNWQLGSYFSGLLFGNGVNGQTANGGFVLNAKPFTPACTTDPTHQANWEFDVSHSSTMAIPANGGSFIAGDFGIFPVGFNPNFNPGLSSWFSQAPGGVCGDTGSSNDPSTYFDDPHYALFFQGNLVAEKGGTDPNTGTIPCTLICPPGVLPLGTFTSTPTATVTPAPCTPSPAIVSPNLDLKVRMIQCNTNDQAVFRVFVRNSDSTAQVRLSDLTLKIWTYDTTAAGWSLSNYFNGNLFPASGNPSTGVNSPFTLSAQAIPVCTLNSGHFANWELDVANNSSQLVPNNGGYFIDGDFGIQRSDKGAFVPGISQWYSQIPPGEGNSCSDTGGNNPGGYFDDVHYGLFYQGHLVAEKAGTDPRTGLRPCFCGAPMGIAAPGNFQADSVEGTTATTTPTISPTPMPARNLSVVAAPNVSTAGEPIQFRVNLERSALVRLTLFTLTGEQVYTASLQGGAGENVLAWSIQNRAGSGVASGLYLYEVEIEDSSGVTRKTGKVAVLH